VENSYAARAAWSSNLRHRHRNKNAWHPTAGVQRNTGALDPGAQRSEEPLVSLEQHDDAVQHGHGSTEQIQQVEELPVVSEIEPLGA
jgi:hypothetical protein